MINSKRNTAALCCMAVALAIAPNASPSQAQSNGSSASAPKASVMVGLPRVPVISATPGDYAAPATLTTGPIDEQLNFWRLNNPYINTLDIHIAKSEHYSDAQLARMLKISKMVHTPVCKILAAVSRGETFTTLAGQYGFDVDRLYDVTTEENEINEYEAAQAATGKEAFKRSSVIDGQSSIGGSGPYVLRPATAATP